jgi:hypothetical protein
MVLPSPLDGVRTDELVERVAGSRAAPDLQQPIARLERSRAIRMR